MFDSLTKREKILAIATGASLVVTLLFIAFFWFMSSYNANETMLRGINGQIDREEAKTRQAMAATQGKD
jgi:Na+/melibiose symporter-like transporter